MSRFFGYYFICGFFIGVLVCMNMKSEDIVKNNPECHNKFDSTFNAFSCMMHKFAMYLSTILISTVIGPVIYPIYLLLDYMFIHYNDYFIKIMDLI